MVVLWSVGVVNLFYIQRRCGTSYTCFSFVSYPNRLQCDMQCWGDALCWCSMMHSDGSWWMMMNDEWWRMMIDNDGWWWMMTDDDGWWRMMMIDDDDDDDDDDDYQCLVQFISLFALNFSKLYIYIFLPTHTQIIRCPLYWLSLALESLYICTLSSSFHDFRFGWKNTEGIP